jgi:ribonuclease R
VSRSKSRAAPFPSREQIATFIRESEARVGKREIARAFRLDAEQKTLLRRVLKEMEADGALARDRGRRFREPNSLPNVAVIQIVGVDTDGETVARPFGWTEGAPPLIYVAPEKRSRAAFAEGEKVLARLRPADGGAYEARVIRRLAAAPDRVLGVVTTVGETTRVVPVDKRARTEFLLPPEGSMGAAPGELVWAEVQPGRPLGLKQARVAERLGPTMGPRSISLITIHDHDIPSVFPPEALAQAEAAGPASLASRADLRAIPLVTIDGEDARDFDDAVWAEPDGDAGNAGGWHLLVAIADVAHYVRPGSPLDREALKRGNSVYFPDRVVPMLPQALSNGWCSLVPGEDRPCLAAHLWINGDGALLRHRFERAMMRSAARLTYRQVQAARDGHADDATMHLAEPVIAPLYEAFGALARGRADRGVLELEVPERRVRIDADGGVAGIELRERLDSHKLIEEFMIVANVAAAEALEERKAPVMYRVHDQPSREKLESLREFLETLDLRLTRGNVLRPRDFNRILQRAAGRPEARMVNEVVLRSQAQAAYDPVNIGHFGLALRRYCHFTSPIRRYADLLVHRALIRALRCGEGGLEGDGGYFDRIAEHISATERRAAAAERDAVDRYTAVYLSEQVGRVLPGRIGGVTRFGLFVTLDGSGGDGLVPISTLPDDYYVHDEKAHCLIGRSHGLTFHLGDAVDVRLVEANPLTGGIILELMGAGADRQNRPRRKVASLRGHPPTRRRR